MRIVYTNENSRLRDFANEINSSDFRKFVKGNLQRITKYDHGMDRVKTSLCKERFNTFLKDRGFEIDNKTEHANGIGNNNKNYVKDLESGEFIGALHLNSDMYSSVYCYATDIEDCRVSHTFCISPHGIYIERSNFVDWSEYQFGKEEHALDVIEDCIRLDILMEGPNGGVLVFKEFEDGAEGWQEMDKVEAAKDLVAQGAVDLLMDAMEKRNKRGLDDILTDATAKSKEQPKRNLPEKEFPER